jgi:hypothetical protein
MAVVDVVVDVDDLRRRAGRETRETREIVHDHDHDHDHVHDGWR